MVIIILDLTEMKKCDPPFLRHVILEEAVGVVRQEAILKPKKETRLPRPPPLNRARDLLNLVYSQARFTWGTLAMTIWVYIFIKPALLKIPACDSVPEALN